VFDFGEKKKMFGALLAADQTLHQMFKWQCVWSEKQYYRELKAYSDVISQSEGSWGASSSAVLVIEIIQDMGVKDLLFYCCILGKLSTEINT
jgi:hypothetical protein